MKKRKFSSSSSDNNSSPPKKKIKLSSYEYINNINTKQHERNKQWMPEKPDFKLLSNKYPKFTKFINIKNDNIKVNWKKEGVIHCLSEVLLSEYFNLNCSFPISHLAPTVTLRTNYLHWIYDLLLNMNINNNITGIDIGTGASCIYPLLGTKMYNWNFLATDIDPESINYANINIKQNLLEDKIETKLVEYKDKRKILLDIIPLKKYDFCICNPPFFDSLEQTNLNPKRKCSATNSELITEGGEFSFVNQIISESIILKDRISIYSSMIGRKINFKRLKAIIRDNEVLEIIDTTEFNQGRQVRWGISWKIKQNIE